MQSQQYHQKAQGKIGDNLGELHSWNQSQSHVSVYKTLHKESL